MSFLVHQQMIKINAMITFTYCEDMKKIMQHGSASEAITAKRMKIDR